MQALFLTWRGETWVETDSIFRCFNPQMTARDLIADYKDEYRGVLVCRIYMVTPDGLIFVGEEKGVGEGEN